MRNNEKKTFKGIIIERPYGWIPDHWVRTCVRENVTTIQSARKVSINNVPVKVNGVDPHQSVTIRVYPLNPTVFELRFWHGNQLVDVQTFKTQDLKGVSTFQS